jgi:hypothetical protein
VQPLVSDLTVGPTNIGRLESAVTSQGRELRDYHAASSIAVSAANDLSPIEGKKKIQFALLVQQHGRSGLTPLCCGKKDFSSTLILDQL